MIEQLKQYDEMYYNSGKSPVSDEYYDSMKEKARELYPNDPYFKTVGIDVPDGKVKLPYILGSLSKVKTDTVYKWLEDNPGEVVVSQKMDGVSIIVIYRNGKVEFASTRGNGEYGKDITDKASVFCPEIDNDSFMVVRGEAMLPEDNYKDLGFKTARNGVAGILNRDEIKDDVERIVPFFYELIKFANLATYTEYERFVLIESLGLSTPDWFIINEFNMERVLSIISTKTNWGTDGAVISLNEHERENVLYPKKKVAFKVQGDTVQATVVDVEWNITRTGRVVPVVVIDPVELNGITITRATGFNAKFIQDNKIKEGVKLMVTRANDVIPYITEIIL